MDLGAGTTRMVPAFQFRSKTAGSKGKMVISFTPFPLFVLW
jgi:hypothetical protein